MKRDHLLGVALGAGLVVIALGAISTDGRGWIVLVLALAVLVGGLAWSAAAPAPGAVTVTDVTPPPGGGATPQTTSQSAATRPAVPAAPPVDRAAAAAAFDIGAVRIEEDPDPIQCPGCGRFWSVRVDEGGLVMNCNVCGATAHTGRPRPRTLVRTIGAEGAVELVDRPTIAGAHYPDPHDSSSTTS